MQRAESRHIGIAGMEYGRSIYWLVFSMIAGVVDVCVMQMYAESQLGRMPVLLPLQLAGASAIIAIVSLFLMAYCAMEKELRGFIYLIASLIWIGLVAINLYHFMGVMYVA